MRKAAIACGVVGVVLLVAAGLLAFWITPAFVARLPSDSNTVRTYDGKIQSLADPAALARGDFAGAIKTGLPVTIRQQVTVLQTAGSTALARDSSTADVTGRRIGGYTVRYAVDRTSLEATTSHPSSWNVIDAHGLTISWPIGAKQQNYTGWDETTHTTTPLKYVRQQQHAGVNTYVYQTTVPLAPIRNAQVLQALPKTLPVRVLQTAAKAGFVSPCLLSSVARDFPHAVQVPLGYTYTATSTYWVAPTTGEVIDVSTSEKQIGGIALPGEKIVPVLPVLVDSYKGNPSSVQATVTDATNNGNTIQLFRTTLPIVLAAVGFVSVVLAIIFWMRGRTRKADPAPRAAAGPAA